jgi:hypothetical protein
MDDEFAPVSRQTLITWLVAYSAFLIYAALNTSGFLFIDHANLMIHEVGHAAFSWAGYTLHILGGTLMQILVPLVFGILFYRRRETTAVACAAFWGFQNFLYIATYMADARRSALPLVGADESDWTILFTQWGVLQYDTTIASWVRGIGWIGMLATMGWLAWMHFRGDRVSESL